ncbi:hypothetical protein K501DRAFT_325979 [Backusella circina FSU 941]|nr:hypothetical protein K501DRAFT_325979 [Backusella circina FSU 941]
MSELINDKYMRTLQPDGGELASQIVSLLSLTIMSGLFGIKTFNVQFKFLSYSRWLVLVLYVLSWAFTMTATIFVSTNNGDFISCFLSEMACDIFYSGTKITIYSWLIEKIWVVSHSRTSRLRTPSYRFHIILMLPYIAILTLMIVFHIAELEEDGLCIIGLKPVASIPLLIYDFVFNTYMTILFIIPLMNTGKSVTVDWKASRLHEVARRTLFASIVSLLVSFANILALTILQGRERGVLCLTCCTVDVTINVVTIHWVTNNPTGKTKKDDVGSTNLHGSHNESAIERRFKDGEEMQPYQYPSDKINEAPIYDDSSSLKLTSQKDMAFDGFSYNKMYREEKDSIAGIESRPSSIQESQSSRRSLTKKI